MSVSQIEFRGVKQDISHMENELLTRNKSILLENMKNNKKIELKQTHKKKIVILIPHIEEHEQKYQKMISIKKEQFKALQKNNLGYVRYFDLQDRFPAGEFYEADQRDTDFLQVELFPQEFLKELSAEELALHEIVREFERVIVYLEETEDQTFRSFQSKNPKFSLAVLEKIFGHWIEKCKLFKRPLLRKNWKEVLIKDKYGPYNHLIKAFHPRNSEETKRTRTLNKMTTEQQIHLLKDMIYDNNQALIIQKLVLLRENQKLLKMKTFFEQNQKEISKAHDEQHKTKNYLIMDAQKIFKTTILTPTPAPQVIPVITEKFEEKPIQFFVASAMKFLKKYNFQLKDFSAQNIEFINKIIQQHTQSTSVKQSESERKVELKKNINQKPVQSGLMLIKRYAPQDNAIYLEKEKASQILDNQKYPLLGFQQYQQRMTDYVIENNHLIWRDYRSQNPLNYCGDFQVSPLENTLDQVRIKLNNKLQVNYVIGEEPQMLPRKNYQLKERALKLVNDMDLEQRLKVFRKKKKKLNGL